ncbi:MAG: glycoside hydrolase family 29 (alpha-L-fucosidase) [Bacteroidetes bacterium]|nr:MAG: glycoside hydrolase family 29 (alpha-L-fucosidase) [Bacteroidota bacterium]
MYRYLLLPAICLLFSACTTPPPPPPPPYGALPTPQQVEWHDMKYYAFVHFNMNTFTDKEWGEGQESPNTFAPTQLDCEQWARICKAAGMKGIILTAKHHDGFCLWPSKYSTHTVAQSAWKEGKGDVLRDLSAACKKYGLKMGIYISPWDRNHPAYGTPEYNEVFKNTLREVLTQYGEIFEVWFDGANGEGPNGKKQVYDFPGFIQVVRETQPKAVIFSDAGPDIRWVGNEQGIAGKTNWATLNRDDYFPGTPRYKELTEGNRNGTHWLPAEVDVSIRPGWYYHSAQDTAVKSLKHLWNIWHASIGRGANLLLNIPVDRRGLIHPADSTRMMELKALVDSTYTQDYCSTQPPQPSLESDLGKATPINRVEVREELSLGQRVDSFAVDVMTEGKWTEVASGTTIGAGRILSFPTVSATRIRLRILSTMAPPVIRQLSAYRAPQGWELPEDM